MVHQLLLHAEAAHVRLVLRFYFTMIFLLVSLVGDRCCSARVKLRLYKHQLVPLHQMTGWISGTRLVTAMMSLGATPAGWLGLVMLLGSVLSLVCDLTVSALVVTTHTPGRCHFNTTGGYAVLSNVVFDLYVGTNTAGPLYDMVSQAQARSLRNGGVSGIYVKVNNDQNFRPDEHDIVGSWLCEATGSQRTFDASTTPESVVQELVDEKLLFNTSWWLSYQNSGSGPHGIFAWSAPEGDRPVAPWTILAAVQMGINTTLPKQMEIYSCHMEAPSLSWLLEMIEVNSNLQAWTSIVMAHVFPTLAAPINYKDPSFHDPGRVIATQLNAMMMIAGAAWGIPGFPATINDPSIGCLMTHTLVPWSVSVLFVLTTLLAVGMAAYLFTLISLTHGIRKSRLISPAYIKAVEEETPDGLVGWMKSATHETGVLAPTSSMNKKTRTKSIWGQLFAKWNWHWAETWRFGWRYGPSNAARPSTITADVGGYGSRRGLTGLIYLAATGAATAGSGESGELLAVSLPYPSPHLQKTFSTTEAEHSRPLH